MPASKPMKKSAFAESLLQLSRRTKRLITVGADSVAIPLALWASLILKFDEVFAPLIGKLDVFVVAVLSALVSFSALGLYRTIVRFMGPKAILNVVVGVSLSVLVVAVFDRLIGQSELPASALAIY
jgi:FlaA1/EpsC-like NDP-sugar epimerase